MTTHGNITIVPTSYQEDFLRQRTRYARYPRAIQIETAVVCNANCNFCPYPTFERQGDRMSDELLAKILEALREIPQDHSWTLIPHSINEPFLDVRVWDVMEDVLRRHSGAEVALTTNASPLTPGNIERLNWLGTIGRVNTIVLSLNEYRKREYEQLMGIPFDKTMANARRLHDLKLAGALRFHVHLSRVGDGSHHDSHFLKWCAEEFPGFTSAVSPRVNWTGGMNLATPFLVPNVACHHWFDLSIKADGMVSLCCADAYGKWPIGDLSKQSLWDVYNSNHYRELRESRESRESLNKSLADRHGSHFVRRSWHERA